MFGYVVPNQKELKVGQLEEYRAWYCGLCRCLQKKYGITGRLSLNYDMTFLAMLLSSLYEPETDRRIGNCIVHPFGRQCSYFNVYLEYAADMNILLMYYKCRDDWRDEHSLARGGYGAILRRAGMQVARNYPQKAKKIRHYLGRLVREEQGGSDNLDEVSGLFGKLCGCLFVCQEDVCRQNARQGKSSDGKSGMVHGEVWRNELYRLGFYLGKFIYLLDAWEDWEDDRKKNNYNPLFTCLGQTARRPDITEEAGRRVHEILTMMIAEACRAFERLPIIENVEILRNILYSGVWCRYFQPQHGEQPKNNILYGQKNNKVRRAQR